MHLCVLSSDDGKNIKDVAGVKGKSCTVDLVHPLLFGFVGK